MLKPRFCVKGKSQVKSQRVLYYSVPLSAIWKRNRVKQKNLIQKISANKPAAEL